MTGDENDLVRRCASGDRHALEILYHRYAEKVWRYGWFVTQSRDAAGDVVQETFLKLATAAGQFEGRSSFATWLFTLTRSATAGVLRKKRRTFPDTGKRPFLRIVSVESPPAQTEEETKESVRRAVGELPPAQRDVVVLCELGDQSIKEAGAILGWTEARVKTTLFRARQRLREKLAGLVNASLSGRQELRSEPRP